MKTSHKKIISYAVVAVLVVLASYYIFKNIEVFKQLKLVAPELFIVMIGVFVLEYVLIGVMTIELLRPFGVRMRLWEAFGISVMTGFYNLITPFRGGMIARGAYLKKKHNFPYTDFLATLGASFVLIFLVSGLMGLFASWMIWQSTGVLNWIMIAIFGIITVGFLGVIIVAPKLPETKWSFANKVVRVVNGWHLIRGNLRVVLVILVLSVVQLLILAALLKLQFLVFGIEVSYAACLLLVSVGILGLIISITPAGLGISEAILVFSAATIGISPAQSLSVALLGRAVSVVVLFVLGPLFSYYLVKKKL